MKSFNLIKFKNNYIVKIEYYLNCKSKGEYRLCDHLCNHQSLVAQNQMLIRRPIIPTTCTRAFD